MATPQDICDMVVQAVKQITGESSQSVKLKQPSAYSGERDVRIIDNWCSAVDTHKDFYGWSDEKTFIFASTLLAGRAAEWLRVYKEFHPTTVPTTRPHLRGASSSSNRSSMTSRWAQQQGQGYSPSGSGGVGSSQGGGPEPMDLDAMTSRGGSSSVVCFFCQKPGHVKRNCRDRIEAIRKLDNSHRYNNQGSGGAYKGKRKQFNYKKPRGNLNAMDNNSDSSPSVAHDDDNKLNTCEHYLNGSSAPNKKDSKGTSSTATAKMVEPLSARLAIDVPHLDQLNSATSSSSSDLPLYGGFAYSRDAGKGGGSSGAATTAVSTTGVHANVDQGQDATTVEPNTSSTTSASVVVGEQEEPELSNNMYSSQEGVSPFVNMSESVPVDQDQQQQEEVIEEDLQMNQPHNDNSDVECSGMSDVGGDGNSTMDEDDNELKHVVEAYGDISPHEEEFDSAMSEIASEEQEVEAVDDTIRTVIDGYDDISSADELQDDELDDIRDADRQSDNTNRIQQHEEPTLTETGIGSDGEVSLHSAQSSSRSISIPATEEEVEEEQIEQDQFSDPIVVTEDDATHSNNQGEASGSHGNHGAISSHGDEMQNDGDQAEAIGSHDDKMEETGSPGNKVEEAGDPGNKMEEDKKTQAGNVGSSGNAKQKISPFAFVAKQSRKALSWQKFRGTDDSLHKNEDIVGPLAYTTQPCPSGPDESGYLSPMGR
ncbi:CCHC-type zinc finger transcription factor [Mucor lusitanicus CBS 277.49]|uniref:CCHC-type zinc finger transcription factor n=1 Tax=Mucor lusitanicus CBS 277.49 TaxID=747725 RepID=A0A162RD64_MUCCL|nr:CCHC-type zinc finger transcription factor [Mucor lusitanicus CBS 277.49]